MSLHQPQAELHQLASSLIVQTDDEQWVVPKNCALIKLLFRQLDIGAGDLRFQSDCQCHSFIKSLFLLAAEDECLNHQPSELAPIARKLMISQRTSQCPQ